MGRTDWTQPLAGMSTSTYTGICSTLTVGRGTFLTMACMSGSESFLNTCQGKVSKSLAIDWLQHMACNMFEPPPFTWLLHRDYEKVRLQTIHSVLSIHTQSFILSHQSYCYKITRIKHNEQQYMHITIICCCLSFFIINQEDIPHLCYTYRQ